MKKYTAIFLALLLCFSLPSYAASSSSSVCNWYFKKTTDHSQPPLASEFGFITEYSGYYLDRDHYDYNSSDKVIYLTFDAGYENGNIETILDVMKEENAVGSFFILENLVKRNPELVKKMNEDGHLICNHTAKHPDMTKIADKESFKKELSALEELCKKDLGIEIAPYFRPPEGKFNETTLKYACELGYKTVFWSFAYADWDNNNQLSPSLALEKLKNGTHNGEILLLHPTSKTNAEIIKDYICFLKNEGFRFATLSELP